MHKYCITIIFLMVFYVDLLAQENKTSFGLQIRPIIPHAALRTGAVENTDSLLATKYTPDFGYSFGAVIRYSFTEKFSFETGISMVNRSYKLDAVQGEKQVSSSFSFIAYEIPINLLLYVRFTKKLYLNASGGLSLDMFPSDVETFDHSFYHRTFYESRFKMAMNANVGMEYRTEKAGFFYLGFSWHNPFGHIAESAFAFKTGTNEPSPYFTITNQQGAYITLDIRYFFAEKSDRKK